MRNCAIDIYIPVTYICKHVKNVADISLYLVLHNVLMITREELGNTRNCAIDTIIL